MGEGELNVAAQLKIYVENPDVLPAVKEAVEKLAKVNKFWEEEVGFGIKVLKVNVLLADSEGGMEKLETSIKSIEGVTQVEVETVTRV
jgi:translation elongation factor aEF-1 beta